VFLENKIASKKSRVPTDILSMFGSVVFAKYLKTAGLFPHKNYYVCE